LGLKDFSLCALPHLVMASPRLLQIGKFIDSMPAPKY
jgi:hypothetical protein